MKSLKHFSLHENVYVLVCHQIDDTIVDIRKFVDGNATATGIALNRLQWKILKQPM